jgi:hypothetical protein
LLPSQKLTDSPNWANNGTHSLLPIDYAGEFSFTQEIVLAVSLKWARAEGLLIRAFSLPAAKKIRSR